MCLSAQRLAVRGARLAIRQETRGYGSRAVLYEWASARAGRMNWWLGWLTVFGGGRGALRAKRSTAGGSEDSRCVNTGVKWRSTSIVCGHGGGERSEDSTERESKHREHRENREHRSSRPCWGEGGSLSGAVSEESEGLASAPELNKSVTSEANW